MSGCNPNGIVITTGVVLFGISLLLKGPNLINYTDGHLNMTI